ncbi:MAG: secretion protein F [Hespellia sp.]|nr:secretion protein F [Hespellia sp.]
MYGGQRKVQKFKERFLNQTWKKAGIVFGVTIVLAGGVFFVDQENLLPIAQSGSQYLLRNSYGEGDREEVLVVETETSGTDGNGTKQNKEVIHLDIGELEYNPKELREILEEMAVKLEDQILAENESLENVRTDLELVNSVPDSSVEVAWELSDYTVMDMTGKLNEENLKDDGTIIGITAVLVYNKEMVRHTFPVCIFPRQKTKSEKFMERVVDAIEDTEQTTRSSNQVVLPDEIEGVPLIWRRQRESRWIIVILLGLALIGFLFSKEREAIKKKEEARNRQMQLDYPGIVNRFTVYIGAGMTVRNAWGKMISDYKEHQRKKEKRYAYEEMLITWHELGDGESEKECYERFGSRCKLQPYIKFGALLAQNLRKGSKGLSDLLRLEAVNAFEERKAFARRLGEEAGTKLLLPMFLMLSVVLIIVVIPAFLSIQL